MSQDTAPAATSHPLLDSLGGVEANTGFVRVVLDGNADGEVWASPTVGIGAVYARHPYGISLVWGDRLGEAFDELIVKVADSVPSPDGEWLQIDPRWAHLPWAQALTRAAPHLEVAVDTRINFTFDPARYTQTRPEHVAPDGWTLRPADTADFGFPGSVVPSKFWRDSDQFLRNGGGWRAQTDAEVAALAFSSFPVYDGVEIGIETLPTARRLGLGAAVAAAMIDDILAQGLRPIWACREGNTGSYRLATRLGFIPSRTLPYLHVRHGVDRRSGSRDVGGMDDGGPVAIDEAGGRDALRGDVVCGTEVAPGVQELYLIGSTGEENRILHPGGRYFDGGRDLDRRSTKWGGHGGALSEDSLLGEGDARSCQRHYARRGGV